MADSVVVVGVPAFFLAPNENKKQKTINTNPLNRCSVTLGARLLWMVWSRDLWDLPSTNGLTQFDKAKTKNPLTQRDD